MGGIFKTKGRWGLKIAAISHDIERAFRDASYEKIKSSEKGFRDEDHLKYHQEKGAKIIEEFLIKEGASTYLIERVKHLVSKHEVGGDEDQNILKDADTISFFENNINYFITKQVTVTSREKVKDKFDFMYERLSLEKAKEIVKPLYEQSLKKIEA